MGKIGEDSSAQEEAVSTSAEGESAAPAEIQPAEEVKPAKKAEAKPYVHTVRYSGETLSLIAQWYTGSWQNWKALADANPGLNPNRINIGDKIAVPKKLLKKEEPLPLDFLPKASPKEGKAPETVKEEKPEGEELELFGPKKQ
jgi:LysM repeat protein